MKYLIPTCALVIVACDGGDTYDTDYAGPLCGNTFLGAFPLDGEAAAYHRTSIDFLLAATDSAATISVVDAAGTEVAGSSSTLGKRVVFTPDALLAFGETYTATLDWECEPLTTTFTVSDLGNTAVDATTLVNNNYSFSITDGRIVDPPELRDVLPLMAQFEIMLTVTGSAPDSFDLIGAVTEECTGVQSECSPSIDFPQAADLSASPYFTVHADSIEITVIGDPIPITDVTLTGTVSPDGSTLAQMYLAGTLDLGDELCSEVEASGVSCETCPTGGDTCVDLVADSMDAASRTDAVVPWTQTDYPACCDDEVNGCCPTM